MKQFGVHDKHLGCIDTENVVVKFSLVCNFHNFVCRVEGINQIMNVFWYDVNSSNG